MLSFKRWCYFAKWIHEYIVLLPKLVFLLLTDIGNIKCCSDVFTVCQKSHCYLILNVHKKKYIVIKIKSLMKLVLQHIVTNSI